MSFEPSAAIGQPIMSEINRKRSGHNSQLSEPRMRRYKPLRPKKLRKYHESEDTHLTSMSGVSIPRCNIDLNPKVRGKGSLTRERIYTSASSCTSWSKFLKEFEDALKTKPEKKKLIHPMSTICGTIITACVFIPAIIPSMAPGSVRGFGGRLASSLAEDPSFK